MNTKDQDHKRLGRPPKHPGERTIRTTIALRPGDMERLDAVPCRTRSDRIRFLLDENRRLADELQNMVERYCFDTPAPEGQGLENFKSRTLDMISAPPGWFGNH
jgi:hypothetical protein